jgi:hypothetical protein
MRLLPALLLAFGTASALPATAQDRPRPAAASFGRNHYLLSLSYGFPGPVIHRDDVFGPVPRSRNLGALQLRLEIPVHEVIGLTALLQGGRSYYRYEETVFGNTNLYRNHTNCFGFGGIASYHFNRLLPLPKLDVYAGAGLGLFYQKSISTVTGPFAGQKETEITGFLVPMLAAGARYYVARRLAVFAEGGYTGLSYANLGLSLLLPD